MDVFFESVSREWQDLLRFLPRLGLAAIAFVLFLAAGRLLGKGLERVLVRGALSTAHRSFFRKLTIWAFAFLGLIAALNLIGLENMAASLVAGGGITAIALGFAFRGIGENLLAGLFLAFSRPFEIGDLIQSGDSQGMVRSIELRYTHIRTDDGRDIYIPSAQLYNGVLVNLTKDGLRRLSFTVGIDYGDDSERARSILLDAARATEGVLGEPPPGIAISSFQDQRVQLSVFFWIDSLRRGAGLAAVQTEVMERCRRALLDGGFTVSANVAANVRLELGGPVRVSVNAEGGSPSRGTTDG